MCAGYTLPLLLIADYCARDAEPSVPEHILRTHLFGGFRAVPGTVFLCCAGSVPSAMLTG